jgi:hypothetical protein
LAEALLTVLLCNRALFDIADIEPLFRALPKLLKPGGSFVFSINHPAFDNSSNLKAVEEVDYEGAIKTTDYVKVSRYMTLYETRGLALREQPKPQVYFERPLQYFVDVAGFSEANAALAVAVWTGVGLLGDFLLIPLVERVKGLDYLRWSVVLELILFPCFLLVAQPWLKLVIVGLMGFFNAGWYAILKANLYSSMLGQSGTVMALDNVSGLFGKLLPLGVGFAAQAFGLQWAMWLLLAGPIALFIGLPKGKGTAKGLQVDP